MSHQHDHTTETDPMKIHTPYVGHEVPWQLLVAVALALLVLTGITVSAGLWARTVELGALGLWIAMIIATIKAALVCLYFMHLRWDRPFNKMVWFGSLLFVMLFITLTIADGAAYNNELVQPESSEYAPDPDAARAAAVWDQEE